MIYRDEKGYPDTKEQDGMDSAVRASLLTIYSGGAASADIEDYVQAWGLCVRHTGKYCIWLNTRFWCV